MDAPAYAAVSATSQVASGATMVCLTTGSGSGLGAAPVPMLKLASNSATFERMADDLDVDCGGVLDCLVSVVQMGERVFDRVLAHASGELTKSEDRRAGRGAGRIRALAHRRTRMATARDIHMMPMPRPLPPSSRRWPPP
jgi:altronate hydrolase